MINKKTRIELEKFYNKKENEYFTEYVELESFLQEMDKLKKAIKNRKLCIQHISGMKYDVFIWGANWPHRLFPLVKRLAGYRYNKNDHTITVGCYGTSRSLEIILHLWYACGLSFKDITQGQIEI